MKENKAPDKLYIDSREHWRKSWTAFTTKAKGDDIEYVRADAFIEKAISWLKEQNEMIGVSFREDFLERFQNYMKGE